MIRATLKLYRRSLDDKSHVIKESYGTAKPGDVFIEIEETWEKPRGDESGKHKRRVSRRVTGQRFSFIDVVSPEYVQDTPGEKDVGDLVIYRPEDFMMIRMKRMK